MKWTDRVGETSLGWTQKEIKALANVDHSFDAGNNLGMRPIKPVREAHFPDMTELWRRVAPEQESRVDVMLVNPPAPDGGIWIRSQHRVGRRSREGMVWPQVSLAQLAAMLQPEYTIRVVDAMAERMGWDEFEALLKAERPRYYITQVTAPTLINDMYGVMIARSLGARTIAFGTPRDADADGHHGGLSRPRLCAARGARTCAARIGGRVGRP